MTLALQGTGVSSGIAIGPVHIMRRDALEIIEYTLEEERIEEEIHRFHSALEMAKQHLQRIREQIPVHTRSDIVAFIDTHLLMLDDSTLSKVPVQLIQQHRCNAEWALKLQRDALVKVFDEMDDPYLRTRRDDVDHVVNNVLRILLNSPVYHQVGHHQEHRLTGHIIIADDLSPADAVLMQHQGIGGFVTERGGPTSHTAILARSLGIPAIVGLHHAQAFLSDHETIIIDGRRGTLIGSPDTQILQHYLFAKRQEQLLQEEHRRNRDLPAVSLDGTPISLNANIELPEDLHLTLQTSAEGVGLYRTEYLFMNRDEPPTEEEQFEVYRTIVERLDGKPLTIRTLDLGADKQIDGSTPNNLTNPALGLRAIRLCLKEPALFFPQLRAIYRASAYGPVRLMLPMISSTQELIQILRHLDSVRHQLSNHAIPFDPALPIGGMIEVPAAAINAEMLGEYLDFFSIGTNDLIQYTLAIDRIDDEVNYLYDPLHPAVLKLIGMTVAAGNKLGIPVTMCGEMAGDMRYTRLLLGLGLRNFSMHPNSIAEVKRIIAQSDVYLLAEQVTRLLHATSHEAFHTALNALTALH
ncbi:MAG: phosphoenolpyruvate--protein phosphotransferase [Gammaproteobacteria bacterium]|nr:phosphoenolpyruvate--protein phosphotransferase [Gammaproteobacteria bacterium]